MATAGVESAATKTTDVHGSGEPTGDDRAAAQDRDQDGSVQKKILQLLAQAPRRSRPTDQLRSIYSDERAHVHTLP